MNHHSPYLLLSPLQVPTAMTLKILRMNLLRGNFRREPFLCSIQIVLRTLFPLQLSRKVPASVLCSLQPHPLWGRRNLLLLDTLLTLELVSWVMGPLQLLLILPPPPQLCISPRSNNLGTGSSLKVKWFSLFQLAYGDSVVQK